MRYEMSIRTLSTLRVSSNQPPAYLSIYYRSRMLPPCYGQPAAQEKMTAYRSKTSAHPYPTLLPKSASNASSKEVKYSSASHSPSWPSLSTWSSSLNRSSTTLGGMTFLRIILAMLRFYQGRWRRDTSWRWDEGGNISSSDGGMSARGFKRRFCIIVHDIIIIEMDILWLIMMCHRSSKL